MYARSMLSSYYVADPATVRRGLTHGRLRRKLPRMLLLLTRIAAVWCLLSVGTVALWGWAFRRFSPTRAGYPPYMDAITLLIIVIVVLLIVALLT